MGINIFIGALKIKLLAIMLGPTGVGLLGLYQSILAVSSTVAGCGLDSSVVRQIALSMDDKKIFFIVRRAIFIANFILGGIGMLLIWLYRSQISWLVFNNAEHANSIGWLGLGVFFALISSSQIALLQGLRRIGDIAKINVFSSIFSSFIGILFVWRLGDDGVCWLIIAPPIASSIFAALYVRRVPKVRFYANWHRLREQWLEMLTLGIPLMVATLLSLLTQLISRAMVVGELGLDASGYFQAAWTISMTYIGFLLGSMETDYLPRLTAEIHNHDKAQRLVDEQTEIALLISAPVLLAMMTLAPSLIELLYAKSFSPAVEIFRWQIIGDVFKVMGFPIGYIVLAKGRGKIFMLTQLNWNAIYLFSLWAGMKSMGLQILGIGFCIAYVAQVCLVRLVAGKLINFKIQIGNLRIFILLLLSTVIIFTMGFSWEMGSFVFGACATLGFGLYSLWRLNKLLDLKVYLSRFGIKI